ncbi:MAG TPA: hypothetical protein VGR19_01930 [Allosphingosinicella sp.]|nr:hypothetical protein [Allosphingosinicella sp.]
MKPINLVVSALAAAAAAAAPGVAQEAPAKEEKKIERVVILTHAGKDAKPGEKREFRIHREGDGPLRDMILKECEGEKTEIDGGADKEKTKIFFCGKPGMTGEERAKRLEELRSRLTQDGHFSAEHRAKIAAALQEAIDRARAGK